MNAFIQQLESRTFLSASTITAANLQADKSVVVADATLVKSAMTTLFASNTAQDNVITADFKTLPKEDRFLLNNLKTADAASKKAFTRDVSKLVGPNTPLATRSAGAGTALLKNPTLPTLNAVAKDIASLQSATTLPLASLQADFANTSATDARTAIVTNLASNTPLVSAVTTAQTTGDSNKLALSTAVNQYANAIAALNADLVTEHSELGAFPALTSTFIGSATTTSGKNKGHISAVTLTINSEDPANGNLIGTLSDLTTGGSDALTGTVTLAGKVALRAVTATDGILLLKGVVSLPGLSGTFSSKTQHGTFTVAEPLT